jgi:hydroxyacylglutathione hydrolase
LTIEWVTNTHTHHDHVVGNSQMIARTRAKFVPCKALNGKDFIEIDGERVLVLHTPGHTADSFTFKAGESLITGDTLFNGTVGNCFSGDLAGFFSSIRLLTAFPGTSLVYAGHDYVREAMAFARTIDPENPHIDPFLASYDPGHVVSTLDDELRVNPYLRFNAPALIARMERDNLPVETEYDRWCSIMTF